jgi:isocitrate/isopropylmalate dehydrogenase
VVKTAMFDPAAARRPTSRGKNIANPFAAFFALASLLRRGRVRRGQALRRSVLECVAAGEKTADTADVWATTAFTEAVAAPQRRWRAPRRPETGAALWSQASGGVPS